MSVTKKNQSLSLYDHGVQDVLSIAGAVGANPTYIASALRAAGRAVDYHDLYTPSRPRNRYGDQFSNVLKFKDRAAARQSVRTLDTLYRRFRESGDRQGQYHAQHIALLGMHRAAGLGKREEAMEFARWLESCLKEEAGEAAA